MKKEPADLYGWEQISRYLDVSIPTAKRYHKELALPVHSIGRRYYAYEDEIDEWKHSRESSSVEVLDEKGTIEKTQALRPRWWVWLLLVALSGSSVAYLLISAISTRDCPAVDAGFDGSRLTAVDQTGTIVWERYFSEFYRDAFLIPGFRFTLAEDIDGDQCNEIIFNYIPKQHRNKNGILTAFSSNGEELWSHYPGKELAIQSRYFEPYYSIENFLLLDSYILTLAMHATWYPAQVSLLDPLSGEIVADYWHPGYLRAIARFDLSQDGARELLLGGINNPGPGFGHPVMAILDVPFQKPPNFANFMGEWNHRERSYVVFPALDLFEVQSQGGAVHEIHIQDPDRIMVAVGMLPAKFLFYYLDSNLRLIDVRVSDELLREHHRLYVAGQLDHPFTADELQSWSQIRILPTAPDGNSEEVRQLFTTRQP